MVFKRIRRSGNETVVQKHNNEQYTTTFPKSLAMAIGLKKRDIISWRFKEDYAIIRKV